LIDYEAEAFGFSRNRVQFHDRDIWFNRKISEEELRRRAYLIDDKGRSQTMVAYREKDWKLIEIMGNSGIINPK